MERADKGLAFMMQYENVAWYDGGEVRILDRRVYPRRVEFVTCRTHREVAQALTDMVTQSTGPFTAAAMGMALAAYEAREIADDAAYLSYLEKAAYTLSHARPTTVKKMEKVVERAMARIHRELAQGTGRQDMPQKLLEDAVDRCNESYTRYDRIAEHLADQIPQGGTIMTQCFAETIIGTLLRECRKRGNEIRMICPETRPYYQGARLTASLARDMGFDTTVITDNMPAYTMKEKHVDLFTSAADVITMDGYVVNKVGTFQNAIVAKYMGIPYFVTGAPDQGHPTVDTVHIEMRDPNFTLQAMGVRTAAEGVKGYYPAFDITPPHLVSGVVTDLGIYSPYDLHRYFTDGHIDEHNLVV